MTPPNERRVPRYTEPTPHEVLEKLKATIEAGHRQMAKIEESALSGHYADRAAGQYPATDAPKEAYIERAQVNRAIGRAGAPDGYTTLGNGPKAPEWTPPHIRVIQAEQRVMEARCRLEAIVDRMCGPQPESAQAMAGEPNPWGGAAGETANSAARIKNEVERISDLLLVLETTVP